MLAWIWMSGMDPVIVSDHRCLKRSERRETAVGREGDVCGQLGRLGVGQGVGGLDELERA